MNLSITYGQHDILINFLATYKIINNKCFIVGKLQKLDNKLIH